MMKAMVTALMSAVAMVPALASAQEGPRREGERGPRFEQGAPRPERGGDGGGWRRRDDAPRPRPAAPVTQPSDGGWQRSDRAPRADAGNAGGWQRPTWVRPDRPEGGFRRPDRDRGTERPRPPEADASRGEWRSERRDGDDRRAVDPRRAGQWGAWSSGRADAGRDWRDGDRGGWNQGRWGQGQWNRGWRDDRRYDWNRYRAENRFAYRLPRYYAPYGWSRGYQRFSVGIRLAPVLFGQSYWIDDPWSYRLPDAYGPYRWIRYYDDALLVDVYSGQVVDVIYGIFW